MIRSRRFLLAFRGRLVRAAALSVPLLHGFACSSEVIFESVTRSFTRNNPAA